MSPRKEITIPVSFTFQIQSPGTNSYMNSEKRQEVLEERKGKTNISERFKLKKNNPHYRQNVVKQNAVFLITFPRSPVC